MVEKKPKVGIISFTDPRETAFAIERERYIEKSHIDLKDFLQKREVEVCDPVNELRKGWRDVFGIRSISEVNQCALRFKSEDIHALIIGCWHWTEPMLPIHLVRELNLPLLLFTQDDPTWAGAVHLSATGASLWEAAPNHHAVIHERVIGDKEQVLRWIRGVTALQRLKKSSLLLWGGTYCLRMEHLQDDIPRLKSFLVGDILSEGQYILIKRAEEISLRRVDSFLKWLQEGGVQITYDGSMLTEEVLKKQIALYLAARDRLQELEGESLLGASLKCQPELSVEYGVTGCLIPSFLPFGEDSEGPREIIATVCEGDIKGLISCALLEQIAPETPPLFGDLKYIGRDHIIISNCGGSSIYYAANSTRAKDVLPKVTIKGQCQGESGGAVGYDGAPGEITLARLTKIKGQYYMQLGLGKIREITPQVRENIKWGRMWPHVAIDLGVNPQKLARIIGSNHLSGTPSNLLEEVFYACREAEIPVVRIDSEEQMEEFYQCLR